MDLEQKKKYPNAKYSKICRDKKKRAVLQNLVYNYKPDEVVEKLMNIKCGYESLFLWFKERNIIL